MDGPELPTPEIAPPEPGASAAPIAVTVDTAAVDPAVVADGVFRQLDPRFVAAERVSGWILLGVLSVGSLVGLAILVLVKGWGWAVAGSIGGGWLVLFGALGWLTHAHPVWVFRRTSYAVSPRGVEIRRGIVWRSVINVPRSRVQHTDVAQGPLMRHFGLASLVIHTAGTANASVTLAGLSASTAYDIRDFLIGRRDADEPERGEARRLHPTSLLFSIGGLARNLLVPGIVVFFFARKGGGWEYAIMIAFVPAVAVQVFKYVTLRYRFARDELVVKQGLVFRNERHIPFGRIQNVDLVQNPLHRLFKVAQVRLETASGTRPEAVLTVLSMDAVQEMRRRIFAESVDSAETTSSAPPVPLVRVSLGELVLLGVIANRAAPLLAIGVGLLWELGLFEQIDSIEGFLPFVTATSRSTQIAGGAFVATVIVFALLALSVLWTIVRLYGFRLVPVGEDMRLECGLFTRRAATIPRRRIQLISIQETFVHRWLGYVTIRIETAGGGAGEEGAEQTISQKWFVPMIAKSSVPALLDRLGLPLEAGVAPWQGPAPRARRRMLAKRLLLVSIIGTVAAVLTSGWGALVLVVGIPLAVMHGFAAARSLAWARTTRGLYFRSGVLSRKVSATFYEKVQTVMSWQSPLDRRHGHARLIVDTAGAGPAGHGVHIPYLPLATAEALREEVATAAERAEFRW